MSLTERQSAFVREYLVDLNATQAAIRAGYSAKTAGQQGFMLLKNLEIQQVLSEAVEKRAKRVEITADRVLKEIGLAAFLDPLELFAEDGTLLPLSKMPEHARRAIAGIEVEEIYMGQGDDRKWVGYLKKIKLVSKEGTLTLAGRHLKMFTEKVEVTGKDGGPLAGVLLCPAPMSQEDWERHVANQQATLLNGGKP